MKAKKKLVKELIRSLTKDWGDWVFSDYVARNTKSGIEIWIANIPILNISVYKPTPVNFGIIDKVRIYKALDECRSLWVLSLNSR